MRFNVSSRGYNMFSRNISYRHDNFSLRNQGRSIFIVVDERGMTGSGIFDSIKKFGSNVINFGTRAGKSTYNAVNKALPYIEKGIDIIEKYAPLVDTAMEENQHRLHPRINSARKSSKNFINNRKEDYDIIQSLRGAKIPEINENEVVQREKKNAPKLPASDLKKKLMNQSNFHQQLMNQSKNLKKSKPSKKSSRKDPMAELKSRLSHIRNNVAEDSDEEWDGAGLQLAGRGMYPAGAGMRGKGIYPAGAGMYPAGAGRMCGKGLGVAGAGINIAGAGTNDIHPIVKKIIPHMIHTIVKNTPMSKSQGKQLLIHSLNKAQPILQNGTGKDKIHKTIAKLAVTPFHILHPKKKKAIKKVQIRIEKMVKKGTHQNGGDFWDALGNFAAGALPLLLL